MDIDLIIFIIFLAVTVVVGAFSSKGIKTIKQYAVGDKNFSTPTMVATIIATCIGGGFFSGAITESYRQGLYFIIPAMGEPLALIILGYFLIPRMGEFLGDLSVADAMGNLYGKNVRIISALSGIFLCIGVVALQFKVGAAILGIFFDISGVYTTLVCAIIVTIYSAFGGVKAVTFTDIIHFFTFGTIIPIISLSIWGTFNDPYGAFITLEQNPLFNLREVIDFTNPKFISTLFLLMFFLVPDFQPVFFQRVVMSKNTLQGRKAFVIGGLVCLIMLITISWIGVLLITDKPDLDPNNLLPYIISTYSYVGLKGLTAIGVMAVIMSSADSYINSAAVLFTNDVLKPLNIKKMEGFNDLTLACIFSFFVGIFGFFIAFKASTVLNLLLFVFSFYAPIVSAPLLLTIFGFRSTASSVLFGMLTGCSTVLMCNYLDVDENIIPDFSMGINIISIIGFHYLLRQPGGWVGIKDKGPLEIARENRKRKMQKFIADCKSFNFFTFCENNSPKHDYIYAFFGFFCIISVFSTMYSMPKELQQQNTQIIDLIYHSVLIFSSIFLTYPIWPPLFKKKKIIAVVWNIAVPYLLLVSPIWLVIISNFGQFQLMILMLNIIIVAMLMKWHIALMMIILSTLVSFNLFKWFVDIDHIVLDIGNLQFKIMYLLLLVSSVLIAFIKPKQEHQEMIEEKNHHLANRLSMQEYELQQSLALKDEFLRNISHEYNTPMTGILSTSETLHDSYDKIPEEMRKKSVENIFKSAARFNSFDSNIRILAALSQSKLSLNKEELNLSVLVLERVERCQKLYDENPENHEVILNIGKNIKCFADKNHLTKAIDNLIINAIHYCEKGKIEIVLKQENKKITFKISDEGIGIPKNELQDIFEHFKVSSKTHTSAGGRGIGLTVSQKIIKLHDGDIGAESDGVKGAIFSFTIPIS